MLKTLSMAAIIAATSTSAFAGNLNAVETVTVEPDTGVFEAQGGGTPYLIPIVACAIICTTLLLNNNKSDDPTTTTTVFLD